MKILKEPCLVQMKGKKFVLAFMMILTLASSTPTHGQTVKVENEELIETDIPVQLEAKKATSQPESFHLKALISLLFVGLFSGGAAWYMRKRTYQSNEKSSLTKIKMLDQFYFGPKKSLALVRVAGESILIGITDQNITHIKTLSLLDEDLPEINFSKALKEKTDPIEKPNSHIDNSTSNGLSTRKKSIEEIPLESPVESSQEGEDFSIRGIQDFVSQKLKNMRSLD